MGASRSPRGGHRDEVGVGKELDDLDQTALGLDYGVCFDLECDTSMLWSKIHFTTCVCRGHDQGLLAPRIRSIYFETNHPLEGSAYLLRWGWLGSWGFQSLQSGARYPSEVVRFQKWASRDVDLVV